MPGLRQHIGELLRDNVAENAHQGNDLGIRMAAGSETTDHPR
jgi:hypothetical protein